MLSERELYRLLALKNTLIREGKLDTNSLGNMERCIEIVTQYEVAVNYLERCKTYLESIGRENA